MNINDNYKQATQQVIYEEEELQEQNEDFL